MTSLGIQLPTAVGQSTGIEAAPIEAADIDMLCSNA